MQQELHGERFLDRVMVAKDAATSCRWPAWSGLDNMASPHDRNLERNFSQADSVASTAERQALILMRLVFVNSVHPDTPHVSGMRLSQFGNAMARRGHSVILLTASLSEQEPSESETIHELPKLEDVNWDTPLLVPVTPQTYWPIEAVRQCSVPSILRRGLTAWSFLRHGGAFPDWTLAAKQMASTIASVFRPDIVWATFGNTSNLWLAQLIARQGNCRWAIDIKDNWEAFVPLGLRHLMARKYSDASGITYNSMHHRSVARRHFRTKPDEVIYSGVAESFFSARRRAAKKIASNEILLVGSTYSNERLSRFLKALSSWLNELPQHDLANTRFAYAGSDHQRVAALLSNCELSCPVEINQQLSLDQLAKRSTRSLANCYLSAPFGFHHKLLELLVAGAPVIVYPGEHEESHAFAQATSTPFFVCSDDKELSNAFSDSLEQQNAPSHDRDIPPWRWDDFASRLEFFFKQVAF